MKIQILSDLHIEFEDFELDHAEADVVVLAGDIHLGIKGVEWALDNIKNKPVIYVMGNHEYYRSAYPALIDKIKAFAAGTHIHLLENESIKIDSITFYGCTLWTDFQLFGNPKLAAYECQQQIPDYKYIKLAPRYSKITPIDIALIHAESIQWLEDVYDYSNKHNNVIISHHAPSAGSIPEQYTEDIVSAGFASHLDKFIERLSPRLWVHGHMHKSCQYTIGSTQVICNPRGYPNEESTGFNPNCIITL